MNALSARLGDSAWTIVYKALIVIHYMIREGSRDVALEYLASNARILHVKNDNVASNPQATSLTRYAKYLNVRAVQFGKTKIDYVRYESKSGSGRLKELTVEKGLLRECESVYEQIEALLKCKFHEENVDNDILLTVFRLLVSDLLSLYQVFNEGVINILEHYFEMSKTDATHALDIYEGFTKQTANVVAYLKIAKHLEHATKLRVPNIKHAPTSLMKSLADYLNDPDFETNHRQYVAEREARRNVKDGRGNDTKIQQPQKQQQESSNKDTINLMDDMFNTTTSATESSTKQQRHISSYNPFYQQQQPVQQFQYTGQQQIQPQQTQNQFFQQPAYTGQYTTTNTTQQPLQNNYTGGGQQQPQVLTQNYTGAGFGGYTAGPVTTQNQWQQPQQQQQQPQQAQVQLQRSNTGGNPFSISAPMTNNSNNSALLRRTSTGATSGEHNPFKRTSTLPSLNENSSASSFSSASMNNDNSNKSNVSLQRTGTNPFARQQQINPINPQDTGTNPFRKSMYASISSSNQQQQQPPMPTGNTQQFSYGGLEALPTVSVFPQSQQQQYQQQQQSTPPAGFF